MMSCSVVINTYNRCDSLRAALESCRFLRHPELEVIVVDGPSDDETANVVAQFPFARYVKCPQRNLAISRNTGIAAARGEIVLFMDDDAVCEPDWAGELALAFVDPRVGAAHGFVRDQTGVRFQFRYATVDFAGLDYHSPLPQAEHRDQRAGQARFPTVIGVNCAFRRTALVEIGGFDEEFEYFLDETEVCARLIKAGYVVASRPNAEVHHKFAPSHLRTEAAIPRSMYQVSKSCAYFTTQINVDGAPLAALLNRCRVLRERLMGDVSRLHRSGRIDAQTHRRFQDEISRGVRDGVASAFEWPNGRLAALPATPARSGGRLAREAPTRVLLISQDYPPAPLGGVGVAMSTLAEGLARSGVETTVVTRSHSGRHTVDFENGVWVHRIPDQRKPLPAGMQFPEIPGSIRERAAAVAFEVARIRAGRGIDLVVSPIWDLEGLYCTGLPGLKHALLLVTTYQLALPSKPEWRSNPHYLAHHVEPVIAGERWLLEHCDAVLASTDAILRDVEAGYDVSLAGKARRLPFGVQPARSGPGDLPRPNAGVSLLFVGRLERRKGVDVLFAALERAMPAAPDLRVRLVGDDHLPFEGGKTFRQLAHERYGRLAWFERVSFVGRVSDDELLQEYASCDLFVAPSLYESFGLIYLEAMRFGKPCIGCNVGGVPEVVQHEVTGLLVPPSDPLGLSAAIIRLAADAASRERMGASGRAVYDEVFTTEAYVRRGLSIIRELLSDTHSGQGGASKMATPCALG